MVVHGWGMIAVRCRSRDGYRPCVQFAIWSTAFQSVPKSEDGVLSEEILLASINLCCHPHDIWDISTLLVTFYQCLRSDSDVCDGHSQRCFVSIGSVLGAGEHMI